MKENPSIINDVINARGRKSERIEALIHSTSVSHFKRNAQKELYILKGLTLLNTEAYINTINECLLERKPIDEDDIFDFGGYQRKTLSYLAGNYQDTIKCVILPELLTHYSMWVNGTSYQNASLDLYGDDMLPTTHHVDLLCNVSHSDIFGL